MTRNDDIEFRVYRIIANMGSGGGEVDPPVKLDALGFDSLDTVELAIKLQDEFGLDSFWLMEDFTPETRVRDVVAAVRKALP